MNSVGYYGMLVAIVTAVVGAAVSLFTLFRNSRDASRAKEMDELREFRKELRDELRLVKADFHRLEDETSDLRRQLGEAQAQITKNNGMFVNVLLKLEGILALKDIAKVESEVRQLVEWVRQFLDSVPVGGFERVPRTNLLENRQERLESAE